MTYNFDTTYTRLNNKLYQFLNLPQIEDTRIILLNRPLVEKLGINDSDDRSPQKLLGIDSSERPFAQAYAGHQFGYFTVLGDGRAMVLGEHITPDKERFDIQLKGSGTTKYSRGGDGKATVTSMIREYLYSQALKNLNIDSSQSLAVITTGQRVMRNTVQDGAVLIRVMKSHIRFGTFEYVSKFCSSEDLKHFADYVIERHYPELTDECDRYLSFFRAVLENTIRMVVQWYRVGFIHGVMNTDNMSITGETFDYGPCSFINYYDPSKTFSSIDTYGRYSFGNQRQILRWNLSVLGITLLPLINSDADKAAFLVKKELDTFDACFDSHFLKMMKCKLGITDPGPHDQIIASILQFLKINKSDYTNTFIEIMQPGTFEDAVYQTDEFKVLREEINRQGGDLKLMAENNPQHILRNHLVEQALQEYENTGSLDKVTELLKATASPYTKNKGFSRFQIPPSYDFDNNYRTHCNT